MPPWLRSEACIPGVPDTGGVCSGKHPGAAGVERLPRAECNLLCSLNTSCQPGLCPAFFLSGQAEEGRAPAQVHRWVALLFLCVSLHMVPSAVLMSDLHSFCLRVSQSSHPHCHNGSLFPLIGVSAPSFALVFGPEKRAGNLLSAVTNS